MAGRRCVCSSCRSSFEPLRYEFHNVVGEIIGQSFGKRDGFAAENFDFVGEPGAAAEDVVCEACESSGEAGGLSTELGNVGLGLSG